VIFRTESQKADLQRSWHRPDRPFFAAGACHILAAAFLEAHPGQGFATTLILPDDGHRGSHVFVSDGTSAFDYHGYSRCETFLSHYLRKIRRFFPSWQGRIITLADSPISTSFCRTYGCRLPSQFLHDPRPRAHAYLSRF